MTGDGNGLLPVGYIGNNTLHQNRCTEYGSVQNGTNGTIGTLPHFLQVIFGHTRRVRSNSRAFYRNSVLFRGIRAVDCHLVVGFVSVNKTEVVVIGLEVDVRVDENILNHLPDNSRHLVAVHLDKRCGHLNFCHSCSPLTFSLF